MIESENYKKKTEVVIKKISILLFEGGLVPSEGVVVEGTHFLMGKKDFDELCINGAVIVELQSQPVV